MKHQINVFGPQSVVEMKQSEMCGEMAEVLTTNLKDI